MLFSDLIQIIGTIEYQPNIQIQLFRLEKFNNISLKRYKHKGNVNQCPGALVKDAKKRNYKSKKILFKLLMH
jgi:hypothetical protein